MSTQRPKPKSQVYSQLKWFTWLVSVTVAFSVVGTNPIVVIGQSQPPQQADQKAALEEAKRLNQQVVQLYKEGKYSTAIPLAESVLTIREKVLGQEHPLVAESLNNLAGLYKKQGNYQKAESLYQRSLAINEKVLGPEHPDVAQSLNNLALLYREQGNYQKAESLYQHSLAIDEKVLGQEHPDFALTLDNLAELYEAQGNYQKAEPLYKRSLAIKEKVLGKEHPSVATSLNNLAGFYDAQGNYREAEPLLQRSLAIREKVLGPEHPSVANSLNNLAALYDAQGNYQKAESLYQRSLAIREKVLGPKHPDVAQSLNNLAALYDAQKCYQKAEPLYQRSLAIREKVLGPEHPDVAQSLNNLALLYQQQGNYQKAEFLLQRSLAILEKLLGQEHPDVATRLNNLALLYKEQGNYQKAEPLFQHSLAIVEKVLGKEHPLVALSLNNLASLYWAKGDITHATDFLRRGLAVEDKNLALIFAVGSEQRKQNYAKTFTLTTNAIIALSLQEGTNNPQIARYALATLLRRKGLVLDAVAGSIQTLRSQFTSQPETQKLFDQWLTVQQQLSQLVYRGQGKQSPSQYQADFQKLQDEKERLEETISTQSSVFRNATQPVELEAIQAKIPKDAALVEIVQYQPYNPKAKPSQSRGKKHYAAAVLHSTGEPRWVDLGEAATIDKSIASMRTALTTQSGNRGIDVTPTNGAKAQPQIQQLARTVDQLVMTPIRPLLGNARHLLLSPDGQLTLIPFEALVDEQGKYLIQRYAFSYLTTGRDLLHFDSEAHSRSAPVVFANIDYDQQYNPVAAKPKSNDIRGSDDRRSLDMATIQFPALKNTLEEATTIKAIFPETKLFLSQQATQTAIKQLHAPSILHLATHGFFLPDKEVKLVTDEVGQQPKALNLENPLLRSGIALAGANKHNQAPSGANDGILTALQVAGLDLHGTQLVVLSACETGLGDVRVGDGVYGLRRALVIAGSETQILSLWIVSDEGTKELMVKYYQGLKNGLGRHEALRSAQLELLSNPKYQHPYYWASFVPSGNWTMLRF